MNGRKDNGMTKSILKRLNGDILKRSTFIRSILYQEDIAMFM